MPYDHIIMIKTNLLYFMDLSSGDVSVGVVGLSVFGRTLRLLEDEGRPSSNNKTPLLLLNFKLTCDMYCYY